ncbi:MAG: hypothetical protein C6P37_11025 [Caldibacillus debilis]|uniref:DUF2179 domain-containing protein n=1 Tax=Caldibacillus debilis TaxID=301148 RepID=A0A3E0K2Y5_9BACI|nr:YitT family protein [Caldibacillus debilis]REJ27632.1 MAG: hypothetical protein C6P37_11025 [Caldibacillus debilis]
MKGKKRRREENSRKGKWMGWADVLIGSAIIAVAFNVFFLPNEIAAGGVSGISTILNGLFRWEPAYVQWALNIPLFIAGVVVLGVRFGVKTLVGTLFLPFAVYLTRDWEPWTDNPLLAAVFGGIGVGLGLGIVFRGNASTGGTDLAAQILAKYTGLSLGNCVALIDGLIVLTAALVFNIEKGLLALIGLYITSKTIDAVQVGFSRSKMAIIITDKVEAVKEKILHNLDRGLTILKAYGGFTEEERNILLVVFDQTEFTNLKQMVKTVDTSAFVVVLDASEVLGKGFKTV